MQNRPEPPNGGFHQAREIAEVVLWILHEKGKKGEWVSLNAHLKDFGITHPAELERGLKYLIEEPRASVAADPDPRATKYGGWDKERKAAIITTEVRVRLTRRGLEDMHRQKTLSSKTSRRALQVRIVVGVFAIANVLFGVWVWSSTRSETPPREQDSVPAIEQAKRGHLPNTASRPDSATYDSLKASPTPVDSGSTAGIGEKSKDLKPKEPQSRPKP